MFNGKNVVLGVTGGIAAYKSADLVSRLVKLGINVHIIMTKNSQNFITPLTFQSLSSNPVAIDTFSNVTNWDIEHISLAKRADVFAVVPASANFIGKFANGIADDMLSTTILATKAPILIAPAMNTNMYLNPAVSENLDRISKRGVIIVNPQSGRLACGDEGIGKLADIEDIYEAILALLITEKPLKGLNVLVSAGPTLEKLDPVRYITNFSSGKMGYSIAKAAYRLGANVVLISGPTDLRVPYGINIVNVKTTEEMLNGVLKYFNDSQIVIKSAAVLDYKPKFTYDKKMKKSNDDMNIELEKTVDILKTIGQIKKNQYLVGFAAETNDVLNYGKGKLKDKNCDMIVANDVSNPSIGFNSDYNEVTIITEKDHKNIGPRSKDDIAHELLMEIYSRIKKHTS
jgi:phosphopantothenoylcysteine decarboxylase/phosphopantothenate--cysteine ligase